jgi:hypothetical protein
MDNRNLAAALEQLNEIHGHMARSQVYRGYRPLPVAFSGALGLLAACVQPHFVSADAPVAFVKYWLIVAGLSALVAASAVLLHFLRQSAQERRKILFVWCQFVPCLAAGGIAGSGIAAAAPQAAPLLPGLWALVFSLGIFSSRPFLPRTTGWVGIYYLVCGAWLLLHPAPLDRAGWMLALVFFVGQCAAALMLYLKVERSTLNVETFEQQES